jgi:hypothetical protein
MCSTAAHLRANQEEMWSWISLNPQSIYLSPAAVQVTFWAAIRSAE